MARLTANNLAKSYKGREVVQDVSLEISSGQIVGLLGPNGAGKTTCFYMIVGIIQADRETIAIDGDDSIAIPIPSIPLFAIWHWESCCSIWRFNRPINFGETRSGIVRITFKHLQPVAFTRAGLKIIMMFRTAITMTFIIILQGLTQCVISCFL